MLVILVYPRGLRGQSPPVGAQARRAEHLPSRAWAPVNLFYQAYLGYIPLKYLFDGVL